MEEQKPTPSNEGASTLDRIERLISGQDTQSQPVEQEQSAQETPDDPETDVEPDGDGEEQASEPQLSTSDLAKYLGIDESALDLDEDGTVKVKTKVDGKEGAAKLQDLLKSYQLQEHVDKRTREAAEREKAIQAREQEVQQQFAQRLQYADNLVNVAAQDLLREFQSIDWNTLESTNPGEAALLRQKFQERQAQLRGVLASVEQNKHHLQQQAMAERQTMLQREAEKLPALIPEWKDATIATKERGEIRDWAVKNGFEASEMDNFVLAHHVAVMRKAMMFDKLQAQKPAIEKQVRQAPKLVKPGQAQAKTQEQTLQSLKVAVRKSGGKGGTLQAYLQAKGIV